MKKKILVVSILAVFTLVAISFATAVSSNTVKSIEKKESPLYRIRLLRAIREKGREILSRFIGERIFFVPTIFRLLRFPKKLFHTGTGYETCRWTDCYLCTEIHDHDCTEDSDCTMKCYDWTDYPPCTSGIPTECGWYTCKMEEPWCNTEYGCSFAC